jgi:hypothetical protein
MTIQHFHHPIAVAVFSLAIAFVGGCGKSRITHPEQPDVMGAYQALVSAVATCAEQLATCAQAADGDGVSLQACRDEAQACRENAGGGALANAISACTSAARECRQVADGSDAVAACREQLLDCIGVGSNAAPTGNRGAAPVAACIATMRACVSADGDAGACAQEVRMCVLAAVGAEEGAGSGNDDEDAGASVDPGTPDDVPAPATPDSGAASSCMEQFETCMSAGGTPQACGRALRECGRSAAP